jgi:hypothetical protein
MPYSRRDAQGDLRCGSTQATRYLRDPQDRGFIIPTNHLHRCFRWNHRRATDAERTDTALRGAEGERLTYKISSRPSSTELERAPAGAGGTKTLAFDPSAHQNLRESHG